MISCFQLLYKLAVNLKLRHYNAEGGVVEGVWCIGDANGKMMLAHAASAQGIAAIECMVGRDRVLNHMSVPAACFTHPEVSFVGMTEEQAREKAAAEVGCCSLRAPAPAFTPGFHT